jgi:ATP-dependent DNA ligase
MPIHKPARERGSKIGPATDGGQDAGMRVVEARRRSADRVLEWTGANHLRHTKFVGLRDDKDPRKVVREA